MSPHPTPLHSMTGFGAAEGQLAQSKIRLEVKSLNHRFLDLKVRLPKEFQPADQPLRALIQSRFSRGSIDFKIERLDDQGAHGPKIQPNLELAADYLRALQSIQQSLGLKDEIRTQDIASHSDIFSPSSREPSRDEIWSGLEPLARRALDELLVMRKHEGETLKQSFNQAIREMEATLDHIRSRRSEWQSSWRERTRARVQETFAQYPIQDASVQSVLESRVAQELAMLLDRTDIEEELTRFSGHLGHFKKVLTEGGSVGRKLDFIIQEISREINTLGNKAQDLAISHEVVELKVRLEQMREQALNIE